MRAVARTECSQALRGAHGAAVAQDCASAVDEREYERLERQAERCERGDNRRPVDELLPHSDAVWAVSRAARCGSGERGRGRGLGWAGAGAGGE